ncbi:MAG: hypothetical protein ACJ8CB_30710 [Ktedonobacteraceae bacterium]
MFLSIQAVERRGTGHQGDLLFKTHSFLLLIWMWQKAGETR